MFSDIGTEVKFIRWPADAELRQQYLGRGIPRLLVVEGGAQPPMCNDPHEDWVRAPISRRDLEARVAALQQRVHDRTPVLDPTGMLRFGRASVTVSTTQAELMELFLARFGEVVYRAELEQRLARPTRNSLDLHIMRLRRRLEPVNLSLRTAWGRGYLLEPSPVIR
ncbi:winged helix-turn-helix domain-containing protein [Saccharothrix syringae]|uniref:Response regulator transcription factor n=1 Tax=Saccharothrix syringae TaxID=103733 RepID=A0A5Q0HFV8_SACSY|nr:winged helix-turn-helix domain-containing protein [Saccharothrix syringae]QFZ24502.1 response regulator transcription factor [Saccharothrix syringae]